MPQVEPLTASPMSASANTMLGALPPSSISAFAKWPTAACATRRPVATLPVNDTPPVPGCWASSAPVDPSPGTTFTSPAGIPAWTASSASRSADSGEYSEGLTTTALPQASAGATRATAVPVGPFHGRITPTTPSGSRVVYDRWPGTVGIVWPVSRSTAPDQ
jgi:hypothetical protein